MQVWVCTYIIWLVTTLRISQNMNPLMLCIFSLHYIKHSVNVNKIYLPISRVLHVMGCLKPEVHKSWALCHQLSKVCITVPYVCGSLVWNIFRVILLAPIILMELLDLWKICATLSKTSYTETTLQYM
jgi:hypothetical protein